MEQGPDVNTFHRVVNTFRFCSSHGIRDIIDHMLERFVELYYEKKLHIETASFLTIRELDYEDPCSIDYQATPYRALKAIFSYLNISREESVLLDYGCGLGRSLIFSAYSGFRSGIGIELSARLCEGALHNIEKARPYLGDVDLNVYNVDATQYVIPAEVSHIFLFNPFTGKTLSKVLDRIEKSLHYTPRNLVIIFVNPVHFEEEIANRKCIFQRRWHGDFYPRPGCFAAIYDVLNP